jgi:toxin CcdB
MERVQCENGVDRRRIFLALMAQFDVHLNRGGHSDTIPFVVIVQSAQFNGYRRRVVIPLVQKSAIGVISQSSFNPTFKIRGQAVVLHPLEIVSMPTEQLGELVGSLKADAEHIIAAADSVMLATAHRHRATLWTQDSDFDGLPGVKYYPKR